MTMPEKIYIPPIFIEKYTRTGRVSHKDEQFTHTEQLIEWLEGQKIGDKKGRSCCSGRFGKGYNQSIDDVIAKLRGDNE